MEQYMRAVMDMLPDLASKNDRPQKRSYVRPLLVAALLLAVYMLLRWMPVDAESETTGQVLELLLLWCTGGVITLAFLAYAARKS